MQDSLSYAKDACIANYLKLYQEKSGMRKGLRACSERHMPYS